ncbi:exodeoxyribonuclease VII large subunit [soil metagenome]
MTGSRDRPMGIAEVVRLAHRSLDQLGLLWLEGEVTQVSQPPSGHLYFSLRDQSAVLAAVMWSRDLARLRFKIVPGQRLRVRGRLEVYERDGKMQLGADFAEPAGLGAAALALEQLKQRLAAEGMFAPEKKRPLPRFPRRIGVVTSRNGAAIHDVIRTIQRRLPTPILIADAAVQGPNAPAQLVNGMGMLYRAGVDVIIIGRGGGAVTDLTAFNHERVVRTISRCPVPIVSAVGHETDLSLADLAADARASTPTAAAELCVQDGDALREQLVKERRLLDREVRHMLSRAHQDLDRCGEALHARGERVLARHRHALNVLAHQLAGLHPRAQLLTHRTELGELERRLAAMHPGPRIARATQALDGLVARREAAMRSHFDQRHRMLGRLGAQMVALSPLAVLDRGYAMVAKQGAIVRDAAQVVEGDTLEVRVARGAFDVVVKGPAKGIS